MTADRQMAEEVAVALGEVLDDSSGMWPRGVEIIAAALSAAYERGRGDGWTDGNRDGVAEGMGDV